MAERPAQRHQASTAERPSQRYQAGVAAGRWRQDPGQLAALVELDRVAEALLARRRAGPLRRLGLRLAGHGGVRGLYLWGGVGRGKTLLCDLLLEACAGLAPTRLHHHRFMQDVHARMKALTDTADTLSTVAAQYAARSPLLVLDEFHVADIADAMILGRLLERLFDLGTTLVATSNIAPQGLYANGLQRARFLPAIAQIEQHCVVHRLRGETDFRLRQLTAAGTWHVPADASGEAALATAFGELNGVGTVEPGPLRLHGRDIPARALGEGVAWFDFEALCEGPRSAADYIELAREHHSLLLSGVPRFDDGALDPARRFVHLVDELYDRNVNLLATAAAAPGALYAGQRLRLEFERCASRLVEMQSHDYLARPHRP
ncbi:MAG: AFG1 family ATPase [Xanthomonadaceae bacterium]|jgi:cell division protein ZapE|nr:AFG1 family ATPase [Xanthomonadaceae bacterium]